MSVRTIGKVILSEDSIISVPAIQIIATVPTDPTSKKIPISLSICYGGEISTNDSETNKTNMKQSKLMSYYYALPHRRKEDDVIGVPLLDTNNDIIRDMTKRLALLMVKKFNKPCYVALSIASESDSNSLASNQIFVIKKCIDFVVTVLSGPTTI
ncbi:hypothetical protein NCAS_0B01490 [Naumovozyma castellii]|uniref:Proteasome assembly chaperone 3 n=1 Tax=Naumovozyma castellii TaxID=27288 RepID=G0VBA9_NAUCA|nr:hypothetical protein NCAS_0B01490 [Naumovozyma castellii CBS 4309]CCC68233.1 hypothetical protein NCAS_0B01490 [Naumovozyma castellii CBS 4309]